MQRLILFLPVETKEGEEIFNGFELDSFEVHIKKNMPEFHAEQVVTKDKTETVLVHKEDKLNIAFDAVILDELDKEQEKVLVEEFKAFAKELTFEKKVDLDEETEKVLKLEDREKAEEVEVSTADFNPPEGHLFLSEVLYDQTLFNAYYEFLDTEYCFDLLKSACKKRKLEVTDEMTTGVMLPIHVSIDGIMAVKDFVLKYFKEFMLAQNYIRGFEEGSQEYTMGVLMTLAPRFAEYMLGITYDAEEGKEPNQELFQEEFDRAIKYVEKHR